MEKPSKIERLDPYYIGSFQIGPRLRAEDPLEELWSQIALYGSTNFLQETMTPDKTGIDFKMHTEYAAVRIRQAVELRSAVKRSTLLTGPLPLYYSFLNLIRAFLALVPEQIPKPTHGLKYGSKSSLLECEATVTKGTFEEYLTTRGVEDPVGIVLKFEDCIARIIEIEYEYKSFGKGPPSLVVPVRIRAKMVSKEVYLHFEPGDQTEAEFRSEWRRQYSRLADSCELQPEGMVLKVGTAFPTSNYNEVADFCAKKLWTDLILRDDATWYYIREPDARKVLPREAYYYIAMFILSNVVRYQPEVMLDVIQPGSHLGWLLGRFAKKAERFFPHLILNWATGTTTFF